VIARQPPPLGRIGEVIISSPVELDRIRLVDFGRAKMRSDESDERWQWLCGDEMAEVEEMLRA
jgi:hypothetical protein